MDHSDPFFFKNNSQPWLVFDNKDSGLWPSRCDRHDDVGNPWCESSDYGEQNVAGFSYPNPLV